MRAGVVSGAEAPSPFHPMAVAGPADAGAAAPPETVRLSPGQAVVPDSLLDPVFENDRRHVMKDLAAFLLDRHLRRLGAMRNPIELRLARLLARLQERSGYLDLGFARLCDYVIERLGISVRRMQALLQMDARLRDLPLTSEAFSRGRISLSQLRLLLRVATPGTEAAWLEKAARLNVRLLERELAAAMGTAPAGGDTGSHAEDPRPDAGGSDPDSGGPEPDTGAPGTAPDVSPRANGGPVDDEDEPGRPISFDCPDTVRVQWEWAVEICRRASGSTEPLWRCAEYIAADFLSGVPDLPARLAGAARGQEDGGGPQDRLAGADGASDPGLLSSAGSPGGTPARDDDNGTDLFEEVLRGYEEEHGPRGWAPSAEGLDVVLPDSVRDDPDDGARELDRRLRELVRLRQGLAWQQGRLLATFSSLALHRALGFLSFGRYCRERAGLGIRRARQLIALDRRLIELPELARAYREGEVSWVKASAVARVADESSERAWVKMARSVTFRRLREEAAVVAARLAADPPEGAWRLAAWQPGQFTQPGGMSSSGEVRVESPWRPERSPWSGSVGGAQGRPAVAAVDGVQMCASVTPDEPVQMCARSRSRVRFWAPDDVAALWQHALNVCRLVETQPEAGRSLEDWECVCRMIASFLRTWDTSDDPKWRRDHRIFVRDGWRCRVPGCSSRRNLQVHHVIYRSHGGGNEDDNLALLCATHHQQGIHAGRLRCRGSCEGSLRWEFGGGHGGPPVMTTVEDVILSDPAAHPGAIADADADARDMSAPARAG